MLHKRHRHVHLEVFIQTNYGRPQDPNLTQRGKELNIPIYVALFFSISVLISSHLNALQGLTLSTDLILVAGVH